MTGARRRYAALVVLVAVALATSGCSSTAAPTGDIASGPPATAGGVFLPVHRLTSRDALPAALLEGTLRAEGGCLRLDSPAREQYLALWPPGSRVRLIADRITVVLADGREVADGDRVRAAGGEYARDLAEFVAQLVGQPVPAACARTGYWLVGEVLE